MVRDIRAGEGFGFLIGHVAGLGTMSAGSSSSNIRSSATLTVTGKTRSIRGEKRVFLSVATVGSSQ